MTSENVATATLHERIALARSPETTDEILTLLTQDRKLDVRRALTERKGLSDQLMQQLVNDKSKEIRLRMAKHPELKAVFQEQLAESVAESVAESKEVIIRTALVGRNDVSEGLLSKLAEIHSRDVGLAILKRKILSEKLINQLAGHRNKDVRRALAKRTQLTEALISTLMEDKSPDVVVAVAGREKLSIECIEKLSHHMSKHVRAVIASRNDLPNKLLENLALDDSAVVLQSVANRDDIPAHLMKKVLSHANRNTRADLARQRHLPREIVDKLAHDEDDRVRAQLAARKDISKSMIETFAKDSSKKVRLSVVCRDDITEKIFQQLSSKLSVDDFGCIDDIHNQLLYIKVMTKARLKIAGRKLVFGDYWDYEKDINYKSLGQLLPILFLNPSFRKIQEIEINVDGGDYIDNWGGTYSFDKILVALSAVNSPTKINRISLFRDGVDLSNVYCGSLGPINKQIFPKLKYLLMTCALSELKLDLPELKKLSIESSGNGFHELLLMLINSNLPSLETLSISAGYYSMDYPFKNRKVKLYLETAHEVWPNLKSLSIGARYAYDWGLLLSSPLFRQLSNLVIELENPDGSSYDKYDDYTDECTTILCKSIVALIDTLIEQPDYLLNIESITVGIGQGINDGIGELIIDKEKISRLKQLYNFNIQYDAFVGGYE